MHVPRSKFAALLLLPFFLAANRKIFAATAIDQSNIGTTLFSASGGTSIVFAQTFTVGTSGLMTGFDLRLQRINLGVDTGSFDVELRDTVGGIPTLPTSAPIIALTFSDMVLPAQAAGDPVYSGLTHFDISSSNVSVHAGDVLALDIFGNVDIAGQNGFTIDGGSDNYSGGSHFLDFLNHPWSSHTTEDLFFKTYVDAAVPEPSSLVTFCGITVLLLRRRMSRPCFCPIKHVHLAPL